MYVLPCRAVQETLYVLASIVVTHMIIVALGPTTAQCAVNFTFNMAYLLIAYRCAGCLCVQHWV
jgi:hypothetical protein